MIARDDHQSHRPSSVEGSCPQIGAGPPSPSTPLVYSITIWKAELNFLGDCDYDANSAPPDITPGDMTGKTTPLQISEPPKLGSSDTSSSTSSPAQADSTSASFGVYCEVKFGNRSVRTSVARRAGNTTASVARRNQCNRCFLTSCSGGLRADVMPGSICCVIASGSLLQPA